MSLVLKAQVATLDEGTGSEKRCGYFFRNWSSRSQSPSNSEETMVLDMALLLVGYVKTFDEPAQLLRSSKPVKWLPTFIWGLDSPLPKRTTSFQANCPRAASDVSRLLGLGFGIR
ncbi:hypothetical protein Tco_0829474 [Tanacetum coccineum]